MIIGTGLIAQSLRKIDSGDKLFFASGVSNSAETKTSEFQREYDLLKDSIFNNDAKKLIYFSTLSVNDQSKKNSLYVGHKLEIESFIKETCKDYLILRIGNVVGHGGNPNTLFNFIKAHIKTRKEFYLHNKARRLLIDIEDIPKFLDLHVSKLKRQTVNLSFPYYYSLREIVEHIEKETISAKYKEVDEGDFYEVDFQEIVLNFFEGMNSEQYLKKLSKKYI